MNDATAKRVQISGPSGFKSQVRVGVAGYHVFTTALAVTWDPHAQYAHRDAWTETHRVKPFPEKKANASREYPLIPIRPKVGPFGNIVQYIAAPSHPAVVLLDKGVLSHRTPHRERKGKAT